MNEQSVLIENGVVTLLEKRVLKRVSVSAFNDALAASLGIRTPILPTGCILYAKHGQRTLYLLEQPPGVRQVRFAAAPSSTYAIPVPYTYFGVVFHNFALESLWAYFSPRPVPSTDTALCHAPLPNIRRDGHVCLGDYRFRVTADVPTRVADVVRYFWQSEFNEDILEVYHSHMPQRIQQLTPDGQPYLAGWAKLPPEEATALPWVRCCTVAEAIDRAIG